MINSCFISFRNIHHKTPSIHLPKRKNFQVDLLNPLTLTLTSQLSPAQCSEEWFVLRRDKLTTSTFSTALVFWKGNRRYELWHEKVFPIDSKATITRAMEWGVYNEPAAIEKYKSITGREVTSLGFATHSDDNYNWIWASPDGLLGVPPNLGILEVKCPFNKGKR